MKKKVYIIILLFLISLFIIIGLVHQQNTNNKESLILYSNYDENKLVHNWLYNFNTREKWEIGKGYGTKGWSPSAKYILFYTLSHDQREFWLSNADGSNLHKIFDYRDYPEMVINDFEWLSDDILLLNVVKDATGSVAALRIKTENITEIPNSTIFYQVATNGGFWFETDINGQLSSVNMVGNKTVLSINVGNRYFSPDGHQMAYFCNKDSEKASICIANVGIEGIDNEKEVAQIGIPFPGIWWSPDGKLIGVQVLSSTKEKYFRVIDIQTGITTCEWLYPSKTNMVFWSPDGSSFIDSSGILLDLSSGEINNVIVDKSNPSRILDWKIITK